MGQKVDVVWQSGLERRDMRYEAQSRGEVKSCLLEKALL